MKFSPVIVKLVPRDCPAFIGSKYDTTGASKVKKLAPEVPATDATVITKFVVTVFAAGPSAHCNVVPELHDTVKQSVGLRRADGVEATVAPKFRPEMVTDVLPEVAPFELAVSK